MAQVGRVEANPAGRPREVRHYDYEVSAREQKAWLEEIHQHLHDREARLDSRSLRRRERRWGRSYTG